MFPFAQWDMQSMLIPGIMLILGCILLRMSMEMRKSNKKSNVYDLARRQLVQSSDFGTVPSSMAENAENLVTTHAAEKVNPPAETDCSDNIPNQSQAHDSFPLTHRGAGLRGVEQLEVEFLTLSRQVKAEIDTKIVALQLMIADADRVLQQFEGILHQTGKIEPSTPTHAEPDRVRTLKQEETAMTSRDFQTVSVPQGNQENTASIDPCDLRHIVVEDPFAINDFGFDKAMRELEQLTANIPAFDAMPPLDMPSQDAWDTQKNELDSGVPDTEIGQNTDAAFSTLPQWDTPMSYPISEYRSAADNRKPMPYSLDTAFHDTLTDINTLPDTPVRRKSTYTNKLLTQVPPQLDTLMTDEPVRKMGSKPHRLIGQATIVPVDDEPLALPVIPKVPPPNAQSILVESTPYYQADESGLDKMAVRKAKRHQLQYLIERGMSPKEIAAHLEMPVGEVELIFSLHKRLTGEAAMTTRQPLTDSQPHINAPAHTGTPMRRPRIIAAENVIVRGDEGRQG